MLGSSVIGGFGFRRDHIVYSLNSDIDFARIRGNIKMVSFPTLFFRYNFLRISDHPNLVSVLGPGRTKSTTKDRFPEFPWVIVI